MKKGSAVEARDLYTQHIQADLAVIDGGMAGVCGAITAAREVRCFRD